MNRPISLPLRLAIFAATTLAGLATVPTRGADAPFERPKPRVQVASAEWWSLRPTQAVAGTAIAPPARVASEIPAERRKVRLVYPALVEAR